MDGDWDEPSLSTDLYGNKNISEGNVITIAELIKKYPNVFASTDQNAEITEDIQIKARVTGNDLGGNLYKQIAIQDETGALIVAVNQNGMNGYLPEGQEILIDLKGLHIGGYRKQPELGAPYNGTSIGRMSKDIWQQHFKVMGGFQDINPNAIQPVEFTSEFAKDYNNNCGKLVVLKDVHFSNADGKSTLTTGTATGGNYVNQTLKEFGSNVVVRTSTYADFGAMVMPTGAVTLTGIATRYNNTWQILIRKTSDIKY
jgi:hypothetical protein